MKYVKEEVQIEGLKTYIFAPENARLLLSDTDLMEKINLPASCLKGFQYNIDVAEHHFDKRLFPTIFHHKGRCFFSLCVRIGESYIDVKYHEKWFCRRCYETIAENVLIPGEDNGIFFPVGWQNRYPSVFHFMRCKKCGERTDRDLLTEEEFHISQA